jgi:hypothetical protein
MPVLFTLRADGFYSVGVMDVALAVEAFMLNCILRISETTHARSGRDVAVHPGTPRQRWAGDEP